MDFLNFTGPWDEWLALSRDAEGRAVTAKDFRSAGWRAYDVGWVHYMRQESAQVLTWVNRAEAHWREIKAGARERAYVLRLRGAGHQLARDHLAAITAYREAVELLRTSNPDSQGIIVNLDALASAEKHSGDLNSAERDYREALRIALAVDYHEGIANISGNLADVVLARNDLPGAEALAREALSLSEKVGRQELIAYDCRRLATTLVRQGKKTEALPHAQRAVETFAALRSPSLEEARRIFAECEG